MVASLHRGQIWWVDLGEPRHSEPGFRRPGLVVQDDQFNQSNLATVIVLSLTSNLRYADFPGNVAISRAESGLAKDSVANVTRLTTIDKSWLDEYISDLPATIMARIDHGLSLAIGLR